jgi:antitoxin component YwqK of YwqJK toxin-antitoxin module
LIIEKGYYRNGKKNGKLKKYDEQSLCLTSIEYRRNCLLTKKIEFFSTKNVKTLELYKDGVLHGNRVEYYSNGNVKIDEEYVEGKKHGIRSIYYVTKKLRSEAYYVNGEIDGECKVWFLNEFWMVRYKNSSNTGNIL